jgi:hypothetical protein
MICDYKMVGLHHCVFKKMLTLHRLIQTFISRLSCKAIF